MENEGHFILFLVLFDSVSKHISKLDESIPPTIWVLFVFAKVRQRNYQTPIFFLEEIDLLGPDGCIIREAVDEHEFILWCTVFGLIYLNVDVFRSDAIGRWSIAAKQFSQNLNWQVNDRDDEHERKHDALEDDEHDDGEAAGSTLLIFNFCIFHFVGWLL